METRTGSCHCGAVVFKVDLAGGFEAIGDGLPRAWSAGRERLKGRGRRGFSPAAGVLRRCRADAGKSALPACPADFPRIP